MNPRYRKVLWVALVVNTVMFLVEIAGGISSGSASLLADAIDFAGDAANYGLSLAVLSMGQAWRARTALIKGLTMGGFGLFVLGNAAWNVFKETVPEPTTMGTIGFLALVSNIAVALLLFTYRNGDADMRSVWLCSRNDAIGNIAVMLAALGVFGTGTGWPDIVVAVMMGTLALISARTVISSARSELNTTAMIAKS
jgi:Co/Zn/Cd efflux system component